MTSLNLRKSDIKLSIIILSFNTLALTLQTVNSIYESCDFNTLSFEVIVLDNASSDGSVQRLEEFKNKYENFRLIRSSVNLGFSKGNNLAVRQASGNYILFLNSDIIVKKGAIEKLHAFAVENNNDVKFCGGKLFNKDNTPQSSTGPFYSLPVVFGALFLKGDYWGLTRSSPNVNCQKDWVSGACLMTEKSTFQKIGGFDEKIFMYMEEIDLLYRAKKQGYNTYFCQEAEFIHLGSGSSQGKKYPILQVFRGFLYFYRKHHGRFSILILKGMLQLKSVISIWIGKITNNTYLISTYEEAKNITRMA
ncbi:hypothetical protein COV58_02325 [Candidatus Roizmanbacteria bacterium CG11_big_fil_rev_8_21_14_0_20_36_8]|uniref:Glycosyltransferase 2-like domain-containing protein n=1 Tax=Candidatus Roizmanbacteria bacterium CG11_big_fil_rev_8_21_14_0_20_36_8 TaxID=1974856 RepID=A0A2M6IU89_9BACT|nr:MAG: hypothetical protein COV58_02325 [Candidatus Roizmanbacteria bacterium CG11_big_fil_rev_8_21_14_0_20_36_8]